MTNGAARPFKMLGMVAETFVLPGVGEARSAIDLPVSRESTTGYPYAAASTLKGSLREAYRRQNGGGEQPVADENKIFGAGGGEAEEGAGAVVFSDMRLLLLPVRSLLGAVRYVTCPGLIFRWLADLRRAGLSDQDLQAARTAAQELLSHLDRGYALVPAAENGPLFLEEFSFEQRNGAAAQLKTLTDEFNTLMSSAAPIRPFLSDRLTVITDEAFAWYAENALPVRMRNRLEDDGTKRVKDGMLWSEEYIAPETVMYALLGNRGGATNYLAEIEKLLTSEADYVRVGANETIGHGWFSCSWYEISA